MKIAKATSVVLVSTMTTLAFAQPIDPWLADGLRNNAAAAQERANQEADRQANARWWARERKILAEIEQLKATPFYGTLIANKNSYVIGWGGGGYINPQRAESEAMELCGQKETCHVLLTISNTCAGVASPDHLKGSDYLFIATDPDPKRAVEKAYYACEAKYGVGKCSYSKNKNAPKYFNTYCSGYNYEVYNQK